MNAKVFRTMIVSAAIAPTARQLAEAVPSGLGMFVAAYSPTGAEPATHYVSEGWIEEQFAVALESPEALVAMLAAVGVTMTLTDAEAPLSLATVSPLSATEVLAEIGLMPVGGEV